MRPTISVVIPFYSGKRWLREALLTVFAQSLLPDEVILVNDGSAEDINDITTLYAGKLKIFSQRNKGAAAARNTGIKEAHGDYIAFLDADDLWSDKKLELQMQAMLQSGCRWSCTYYQPFRNSGTSNLGVTQDGPEWSVCDLFPKLLCSCPIATPTVMVERKALLNTELFNSKLQYGEDYCLWIELAAKYQVVCLKNELAFVRIHGSNASKKASIQLRARRDIWLFVNEKNFFFGGPIPQRLSAPFLISLVACSVLDSFDRKLRSQALFELVAKVLYLLPWSMFKFLGFLYKNEIHSRRRTT